MNFEMLMTSSVVEREYPTLVLHSNVGQAPVATENRPVLSCEYRND